MAPLFSQFAIIHIDASGNYATLFFVLLNHTQLSGHEEDAASLASFPKFEELALQVKKVVEHFKYLFIYFE